MKVIGTDRRPPLQGGGATMVGSVLCVEGFEGFPYPFSVETCVLQAVEPDDEHREVGREEVAHVGDDPGACRHPVDGPGVGEHHQDGGEGEEGEEPGVAGADPGRSPADEGVPGRSGEEEGEERDRRDLEERRGSGTGRLRCVS